MRFFNQQQLCWVKYSCKIIVKNQECFAQTSLRLLSISCAKISWGSLRGLLRSTHVITCSLYFTVKPNLSRKLFPDMTLYWQLWSNKWAMWESIEMMQLNSGKRIWLSMNAFDDVVFLSWVCKLREVTFGINQQFCGNTHQCMNVLVELESNKILMSLQEVLVPIFLQMVMEYERRFDFCQYCCVSCSYLTLCLLPSDLIFLWPCICIVCNWGLFDMHDLEIGNKIINRQFQIILLLCNKLVLIPRRKGQWRMRLRN